MIRSILVFFGVLLAMSGTAGADKADTVALKDARAVMDEFMTTFNARDEEAWAATFHYPHIRMASQGVVVSETAADVTEAMDFKRFAAMTGWHHSAWDRVEPLNIGKDKVHFSVTFTRYRENGEKLATYDSLYVVTKKDGKWGIQARSSFAP